MFFTFSNDDFFVCFFSNGFASYTVFHLKLTFFTIYENILRKIDKKIVDGLTCLSVKFKFLASSQRFCFETYALKRNSFSNSSVWNLEYGLRFLRTVTWPVHSSALEGVHEPTEPTPTVDGRPVSTHQNWNHDKKNNTMGKKEKKSESERA